MAHVLPAYETTWSVRAKVNDFVGRNTVRETIRVHQSQAPQSQVYHSLTVTLADTTNTV